MDFETTKPKTLQEAVDLLLSNFTEEDRRILKLHGATMLHHGFGTALRNGWGLWTGSRLAEHFKDVYGIGHPDDMSAMILDCVEAKVKGEPWSDQEASSFYRSHWEEQGIDPLTLERLYAFAKGSKRLLTFDNCT